MEKKGTFFLKNGEKHLKSLDIMGGNQGGMNYKCEITFV